MQPRPLSYRSEVIGPLLRGLAAGECCSVVGTSGVGKSNLVSQLLRPEVQREAIGPAAAQLRLGVLDTNLLPELSPLALIEALAGLLLGFAAEEGGGEVERLRAEQRALREQPANLLRALSHCDDVAALACARCRPVVIFDEFDPLYAALPSRVLRNLRGLRDRYKYRLSYVTLTRQPLVSLRDAADWDEIEPFVELLTLHELGLGPLAPADSADELLRIAARHGAAPDVGLVAAIVAQSGGHPALLRALTIIAAERPGALEGLPGALGQLPGLRLECAKIWRQLSGDEQDTLLELLQAGASAGPAAALLRLKGLIRRGAGGRDELFSPLFGAYLQTVDQPAAGPQPLVPVSVDSDRRIISYYGRELSHLPPLMHRLLLHLWERRGALCTYEELAEALHPGEPIDDLERVKVLGRRLRTTLAQAAPEMPVPILVYPGIGLRLGLSGAA